jgi:transcriptional regulator with XRE-family HTH domain
MNAMPAITKEKYRELYQKTGKQILELRLKAGLTQAQLAAAVSLTRTSITNIEKGRQKIFLHTLFELAAALGADPGRVLPPEAQEVIEGGQAKVPNDLSKNDRVLIQSAITKPKTGR